MRRLSGLLIRILIAVLLVMPLSGCWDRRELDELGIAMGLGIDKKGKEFILSAQIVVPGEIAANQKGSVEAPVTLYEVTAPTLFEALRKMTVISPRTIFLAHVQVAIFGEELAREGVADVLDILLRESKIRRDYYVLVSKAKEAREVLRILTTLDRIPANQLSNSLKVSSDSYASIAAIKIEDLVNGIAAEGDEAVLTGLVIQGDEQEGEELNNVKRIDAAARLRLKELSVFNKDKLMGWLDEKESKGYNYIKNRIGSTVGYITTDGGTVAFETINCSTKIKVRIINDKPVYDIHVKTLSRIAESNSEIPITDLEMIKKLEDMAAEKIVKLMESVIEVEQHRYKVDFLGLGQALQQKNAKLWNKLKPEWNNKLPELEIHCHAEVDIKKAGTTNQSLKKSMEET
ncbi:spore germination protein KC [Paenibacillus albidus]|uniref:Spore germination protein KC n=1 Tax=Paenibacillus albidus TaxID=2041023 RepID=A0A917FI10_9BACL|nr:Ger(x)C family spore germination protein [Paenibacillus albidus]GGF84618.1 spore germination protein KC [Paenibacillus albidus]